MNDELIKMFKRPVNWLIWLLLLPFKLLISIVGNVISIIISVALFIILLLLLGMVLGFVPSPEFLQPPL